jgi:glycosyltransferase involved in cell wall biosynthesis
MPDILLQLHNKISVPTISTIHTTIEGQQAGVKKSKVPFFNLERSDKANILLHRPLRICESLYVKRIRSFVAVSEYIKSEAMKFLNVNGDRIDVIHNGIDPQIFSPSSNIGKDDRLIKTEGEDYSPPIVLFTGRFISTKGMNTIINAIPLVIEKHSDVKFIFIGGGNYDPYLQILVEKNVPRQSYEFLGYIDDYYKLPQFYNEATIYLAPSIYESLPIRILEAMSCGKPVIASQVGGITEIISTGYNGILIPPMNSYVLADKIILLLEDDELRKRIGERARETILNKFSAKKMAYKTTNAYKKCLAS